MDKYTPRTDAHPYRPLYVYTNIPPKPILDTREVLSKVAIISALVDLVLSCSISSLEVIQWEWTGVVSKNTKSLVEKATGGRMN